MKIAAKPKHKLKPKLRLARQADCDHAADVARLYRDQTPCVVSRGPDGTPKVSPMTGDDLADQLEWFATHRTFHPASDYRLVRDVLIRLRYGERRAAGESYEVAVENVANIMDCSETTVRTALITK